ncbi:MAG: GNAT family N-acetyltransferase [Lachnospiraceae bacterium]|nr:GNAT family N-acetyltransferase [Lachnospiraceae bacterium]
MKKAKFTMLKQIIFILKTDQSFYIKTIISDIKYLAGKFKENEVKVSYLLSEDNWGFNPSYIKEAGQLPDTLYLADDAETLEKMLAAGYYVIAHQHDQNHRADLQKALYAMSEIRDLDFDSFLKAYQRLAGLPWHILDTKRLTLRETTIEDVDEFYRIYSDPLITLYIPNLLNINEERIYAAEYIKTIYTFYGYGIWTVTLRETGEVIGRAGISWREGFSIPELGFVIAQNHQRKGYAEEILRAILELALRELELNVIQALVRHENIASMNLLKKLGFVSNGKTYLEEEEYFIFTINLA